MVELLAEFLSVLLPNIACVLLGLLLLGSDASVPLLRDAQLDALALGQRHPWLSALPNHKHIAQPGGKGVSLCVLDVHDVKGARVPLSVGDQAQVARIKLDEVLDLPRCNVNLDSVVDLDEGVWVADGAAIVGGEHGHTLGAHPEGPHTAQLVLGFIRGDSMNSKPALHIIDQAEVLIGSVNGDDVHEASWVAFVCAHLAIDYDEALIDNFLHLSVGKCIFEAIAEEHNHGQTLPQLVGASAGTGGKHSSQLV